MPRPPDSGLGVTYAALARDVAPSEARGRPERAPRLGVASLGASAEPVEARAKRVEGQRSWSPGLVQGAPRMKHRSPRHALRHWSLVRDTVASADQLLLLADFDGTLAPIVSDPARARLPQRTKRLLRQLSRLPRTSVGIISGRSLRFVRQHVGLPSLIYVGNHGCEIIGPGLRFVHPRVRCARPLLRRVAAQLTRALRGIRGSLVEYKGFSLSVHWRNVSARDGGIFLRAVRQVLQPWVRQRRIRLTYGKHVIEVRAPVVWDKGHSVEWIRRHRAGLRRALVCYLGDDRTDEDAFRIVNRLRGLSIVVGRTRRPTTTAHWRLQTPGEVQGWLARFLALRQQAGMGRRARGGAR